MSLEALTANCSIQGEVCKQLTDLKLSHSIVELGPETLALSKEVTLRRLRISFSHVRTSRSRFEAFMQK